ncbi:hypothetical protein GIB67_002421 [Kingdonia uniflora]|uniref:Uncharacterized protein n=1 Tax=Kingdonia uniflora TaxID=39325 RepID=A0A7J7MP92_9MAGN|nr:hypothetical protein GIB67_002421 [Kingdonia uniflora]
MTITTNKVPLCVEGWDEVLHEIGMPSETFLSTQEAEILLKSLEDLPILVVAGAEDTLVSLKSSQVMVSKLVNFIGPIPFDDGRGKEIATLISTTMKTNKTFYTDYNGTLFAIYNILNVLHVYLPTLIELERDADDEKEDGGVGSKWYISSSTLEDEEDGGVGSKGSVSSSIVEDEEFTDFTATEILLQFYVTSTEDQQELQNAVEVFENRNSMTPKESLRIPDSNIIDDIKSKLSAKKDNSFYQSRRDASSFKSFGKGNTNEKHGLNVFDWEMCTLGPIGENEEVVSFLGLRACFHSSDSLLRPRGHILYRF